MSVWQSNLNVLRTAKDKQLAQRKQFEAKVNGDAVEIDDNGRVLLPAATRKLLGITGKDQVWLDAFNGRVNLVTKTVYDERMRESDENQSDRRSRSMDEMEKVSGSEKFYVCTRRVMLEECLEYLSIQPNNVVLDATCGLGGHTGAIARRLSALGGTGRVIACDRDAESLELAKGQYQRIARGGFASVKLCSLRWETPLMQPEKITQLDGLLADLQGVAVTS